LPLSLASVKSRLVLPFWYWLTRVCVCVYVCICMKMTRCLYSNRTHLDWEALLYGDPANLLYLYQFSNTVDCVEADRQSTANHELLCSHIRGSVIVHQYLQF